MKDVTQRFSIQSYVDENRDKLDESLVSLRLMKEIDRFLDYRNMTNKDLAAQLGYSESYISQLMSGVRNVNVGFINKFEKRFSTRFDFTVFIKYDKGFMKKTEQALNFNINLNFHLFVIEGSSAKFSAIESSESMFPVTNDELQLLEYGE